uniref:Uncharacterized protein n=1 Tax=Candidatus Kentrum sp. DK TaxID=2126562 RepID=A0A450S5U7_9GAMM|nr:MAG: hypothetical protein BECKDK2373B_GA0170837_101626 [Candidatus Kentron sp. DK]
MGTRRRARPVRKQAGSGLWGRRPGETEFLALLLVLDPGGYVQGGAGVDPDILIMFPALDAVGDGLAAVGGGPPLEGDPVGAPVRGRKIPDLIGRGEAGGGRGGRSSR